jgi:urease accessory protein
LLAKATADSGVFAGNRAVGRVVFSVTAATGTNRRGRVQESGSLRVRFPNVATGAALDAVIVNTAGGMTGGDRFDIDISVGPGARLVVTTAAAEKVYRSAGAATQIGVKLDVGPGATLAWLPQTTILFDRVRLRRTIEVDLAPDARLILAEAVVFGRAAMGEEVVAGQFFDRWRVRIGGRLMFAESQRLDGAVARTLSERAATAGGVAIATVLNIPGDEFGVAAVRALEHTFRGEVGISAWNGLTTARLVAPGGEALHHDLTGVLSALSDTPLPRLWLN